METWLKESLELLNISSLNLSETDYNDMIYVFYDYFSNRNLAKFISHLYDIDEASLLFEIDTVMASRQYDLHKVKKIMICLKNNGFDKWSKLD